MASPPTTWKHCRKPCPYGAVCYRKNPAHFKEFSHPGDKDHNEVQATDSQPCTSALTSLPPCRYGAHCFRRNLLHFAEYSHPQVTAGTTSSTTASHANNNAGGDDSDTDICDSDEDAADKELEKAGGNEVLKRGMSLVKTYSQMTEAEQKELIRKAFAAKQALQKEIEATKKEIEDKDKQLSMLNEELKSGILLMEGEKEALEGQDTVYFSLAPERHYKQGSAAQTHYRLAESQFYRLLTGNATASYTVTKVDYVVTPHLVKRFRQAQEKLKKTRGEKWCAPVLGFHGTVEQNIQLICENGFKVPGEDGFVHRVDTGYYGAGAYFSEYPAYSMGYIAGSTKLLLCQVLPGKTYQCTQLIVGAKLKAGYDSHMSPNKKELVIFSSHHILPCYVVHYTRAQGGQFTYRKARQSKHRRKAPVGPDAPVLRTGNVFTKRMVANNAPLTKALEGKSFRYVGSDEDGKNLFKLITRHKGKKGTGMKFDVLVAVCGASEDNKVVEKTLEKDLPVVTEEFIYECVLHKKFLDPDYFLHDIYDQ